VIHKYFFELLRRNDSAWFFLVGAAEQHRSFNLAAKILRNPFQKIKMNKAIISLYFT